MIEHLRRLGEIWSGASGLSLARLGTVVVNRGHFFAGLEGGKDCGTETFEKFLLFFRDGANWPDERVPQEAADLLDNFENIAVETAASTGKAAEVTADQGADQGATA